MQSTSALILIVHFCVVLLLFCIWFGMCVLALFLWKLFLRTSSVDEALHEEMEMTTTTSRQHRSQPIETLHFVQQQLDRDRKVF